MDGWGCAVCAFVNGAGNLSCENCNSERSPSSASRPSRLDGNECGDKAHPNPECLERGASVDDNKMSAAASIAQLEQPSDDDEDMKAAIKASLQELHEPPDLDLKAAIEASLAFVPEDENGLASGSCSAPKDLESSSIMIRELSTGFQNPDSVNRYDGGNDSIAHSVLASTKAGKSASASAVRDSASAAGSQSSEDSCFRKLVIQVQLGQWKYENYFRLFEQVGKDKSGVYKLVNRLHSSKDGHGRTPLALAVLRNQEFSVRCLVLLGADINLRMGPHTALTLAIQHEYIDCSDLVRVLLSLGADPAQADGIEKRFLNRAVRYWLQRAKTRRHLNSQVLEAFSLQGLNEIDFAVVGERVATSMAVQSVLAHCGNRTQKDKPLVLLITGPPGHGKTYFTRNLAASIVGKDNFCEISCSSIRTDRQLFGMSAGTSTDDGIVTAFLRERQDVRTVIMLDEIEKIKDAVSELGWEQDKKIYKAFLEPWQEGSILAPGASATCSQYSSDSGRRISCANCIFICTTNEGQEHILSFYEEHKARLCAGAADDAALRDEMTWIDNKLVKQKLSDCFKLFFRRIDKNLEALYRRFDKIIPFMPFKPEEAEVVADIELRARFAPLHKPPKLDGALAERRLAGNLRVLHDDKVSSLAAADYDQMQGASSMMREAERIHAEIVEACAEAVPRFTACQTLDVVDIDGKARVLRQIWVTVAKMDGDGEPQMVIKEQEPEEEEEEEREAAVEGEAKEGGSEAGSHDDFDHLLELV